MLIKWYFGVLIFLCQQVTCNKTILQRKSRLIFVTDINKTSKRAVLQKDGVTKFIHRKKGIISVSELLFGVFYHNNHQE